MRKILQTGILLLIFLLTSCGSAGSDPNSKAVERQLIIELVCGPENQADCLASICETADKCPLISALTNKAVFDFIKTYSECDGCNTPDFAPGLGIGKCIEYRVLKISSGWTIPFWVSENCSFRYGSPGESRIIVDVNFDDVKIGSISPPVEYIADQSYCQADADCYCFSGSGLPLIGSSNFLYAPLHWSGYYAGGSCRCKSNQCTDR
jgi:hypothetical protein